RVGAAEGQHPPLLQGGSAAACARSLDQYQLGEDRLRDQLQQVLLPPQAAAQPGGGDARHSGAGAEGGWADCRHLRCEDRRVVGGGVMAPVVWPTYESYVDSGVEWLGCVPTSWELKRLGSLFNERRSKVSDQEFQALSVTRNGVVPQLESAAKTNDGDNR